MENTEKTRISKFFYIISVLLVGALGSGLWDVFLKDFLFKLGGIFVSIASSIYSGYLDSLYDGVGANNDILLYMPAILIIFLIISFPVTVWFTFWRLFRKLDKIISSEKPQPTRFHLAFLDFVLNKRKTFYFVMLTPAFFLSVLYIHLFIVEVSTMSAVNYIERAIEIVRPAIDDKQYHEYRSNFRQIHNKGMVVDLISKLAVVAEQNNLSLPELRLYGIEISSKAIKKRS